MSDRVKDRLRMMGILTRTTHEDRVELDRRIEAKTGKYCDDGVDDMTDEEIMELLRQIWADKNRKPWEKKKSSDKKKEAELAVV